jgi:polyhydroxybutyrate depolymerase
MFRTVLATLALLLAGCESDDPKIPAIPYGEGLTTNFITVNGSTRKYLVYRPAGMETVNAVVTVLHGGGGLGLNVSELGTHPLAVFRTIADTEKFLVVYPEGSLDVQGNPGWNDCRRDDVSGSQGDDITFLKQLNSTLANELNMTPNNMYLTGTSNGALMTYAYAFQFPETIRAVAVSSGNLPLNPEAGVCTSGGTRPLPILLTHGTSDPAMPANGGCVANLGGACNRGEVVSQAATVTYWLQRNGLTTTTPTQTSFDLNTTDAGNVERRVYEGPNPIVYLVLNNAGHSVASRTVFLSSSPANGVQNRDIEYAEEVWNFFKGLR